MADTFELGRAIGGAMNPQEMGGRSGSLAEKIAMQQYGANLQHDKWTKQQMIGKGYGVGVEKGQIAIDEKAGYSPKEAFLAVEGWKATQMKAFDDLSKQQENNGKKYNWAMGVIEKSASGATAYKGDQRVAVEEAVIMKAMDAYKKVYGKPINEDLGIDPLADYRSGLELKEVFDQTNKLTISKAYANVQNKKNTSTSTDHLNYSQSYFMLKSADREGWPDPKELQGQFPPRDVVEAQTAADNWKKEAQFGGDLSRATRTAEQTSKTDVYDPKKPNMEPLSINRSLLPTYLKKGYVEGKGEKGFAKTEVELTRAALGGDQESQAILDAIQKRKADIAKAGGLAQVDAKLAGIDAKATAKAVYEGRENIENVVNAFGIPLREIVRKHVLTADPDFNFLVPRANIKSLTTSLSNQQKQRGMMGSFVANIGMQVGRIDEMMDGVIKRSGVRALDLPARSILRKVIGSGAEAVLEGYLTEVSNEIGKLSSGAQASVRELSESAAKKWSGVHDPNLSFNELKKVLDETNKMAEMRLRSTQDEIDFTISLIRSNKGGKSEAKDKEKGKRFTILEVK